MVPFLAYPVEIRRTLYTTNVIESLNAQLRKVLRPKGHFPSDEAVTKIVFLALQHANRRRWGDVIVAQQSGVSRVARTSARCTSRRFSEVSQTIQEQRRNR